MIGLFSRPAPFGVLAEPDCFQSVQPAALIETAMKRQGEDPLDAERHGCRRRRPLSPRLLASPLVGVKRRSSLSRGLQGAVTDASLSLRLLPSRLVGVKE